MPTERIDSGLVISVCGSHDAAARSVVNQSNPAICPASIRSRRTAKTSGNASALVTAETERPCARASDLTRLVSCWRVVERVWSFSRGDAAIVVDVMRRVSPRRLVRDHGRARGDYGNTREVLLTAPFARRAWRAEAGVYSANLRKDHGIVSASGSTELLPAVASCREVSGKTPVGRTLSRRIE